MMACHVWVYSYTNMINILTFPGLMQHAWKDEEQKLVFCLPLAYICTDDGPWGLAKCTK